MSVDNFDSESLNNTIVKSKRGRKPKTTTQSTTSQVTSQHVPGKRGRKPKQVYACNEYKTNDSIPCTSDDENIILKLNISNESSNKLFGGNKITQITFQDEYPDAYNDNHDMHTFISKPLELQNEYIIDEHLLDNHNQQPNVYANPEHSQHSTLKIIELLKDFEEKNKQNEWPTSTSIHCYWCCHNFTNTPFGIPVKYFESKFHVHGCFCSLECAAAYNLSQREIGDEIWERYSLINMLSRMIDYKNYIKPAPPRLSLKIFGGHMDIDEFRNYCNSCKIININFPPMMTMTQQIEEINEGDLNNDFKYIPIDTERINRFKEKLKLKRQKPITNFKNTLDHTMNLKYGG